MFVKPDFIKSDVTIHSAFDIKEEFLVTYYKSAYPDRFAFLQKNWRWLNRSMSLENKIPVVLLYQNQVVGHGGLISTKVLVGNTIYKGGWFIDLSILPDFRGHGYGTDLVMKRMEFTSFQISFPNKISSKIFKKLGWEESSISYMHYNFIFPFDHPKLRARLPVFICNLLNFFSVPLYSRLYKRYAYSDFGNHLLTLTDDSLNVFIDDFHKSQKSNENVVTPLRDLDFLSWRLLKSPNKDNYLIYRSKGFSSIVLLNSKIDFGIDILLVSDIFNKSEVRSMICTLALYGQMKGYAFIRFYTSITELSWYIKKYTKSYVTHPKFVFFSKNPTLLSKLKTFIWNLEIIDSDFEFSSSED